MRPDPRVDFPEAIQIVRLGASLLVIHQREIHGIPVEALTAGTSDQVEWLLHRQMCLLTDEGCAWRSDPDVLRPDGWGPLRLGMSREDVEATGVARSSASAGDCTIVDLGPGEGLLSESDELVSIHVPEGVTTPDGIGPGSSRRRGPRAVPLRVSRTATCCWSARLPRPTTRSRSSVARSPSWRCRPSATSASVEQGEHRPGSGQPSTVAPRTRTATGRPSAPGPVARSPSTTSRSAASPARTCPVTPASPTCSEATEVAVAKASATG